MTWPTPQDYFEAVQNPRQAFEDAELMAGAAEETPLGLPKVISGQFASVFKFRSKGATWAVRCFLRELSDYQARYHEISKVLKAERFPFTASFDFVPHGIRVRGAWYPIVKMEWLTGQLLSNYVAANLSTPEKLLNLAQQIAEMHVSLTAKKVAHGDLQHGNIIVSNDKAFLIDYDGMFVPALAGKQSHEVGHRNYQHPFRSESTFDERVDTFSVWIIYLSLIALARDRSLWHRLKGGDDALLLKASDFKEPYNSTVLEVLKAHSNAAIQNAAFLVEELCYSTSLASVRSFDPLLIADAADDHPRTINPDERPWWAPEPKSGGEPVGESVDGSAGGWLTDHFEIPTAKFGAPPNNAARALVLLIASSFCGYLIPFYIGSELLALTLAVHVGVSVVLCWVLVVLYRQDPAALARRLAAQEVSSTQSEKRVKEKEVAQLRRRVSECSAEQVKAEKAFKSQLANLDKQFQASMKDLSEKLGKARQAAHSQQLSIRERRAKEKSAAMTRCAGQVNGLRNDIARAQADVTSRLASELRKQQDAHISLFLSRTSIYTGSIYGVGDKLKARLEAYGIRTAADATNGQVMRVPGIGPQKSAAIESWRSNLIAHARSRALQILDPGVEAGIRATVDAQVRAKQSQISQLEAQRDAQIRAIESNLSQQLATVDQQLRTEEAENARRSLEVRDQSERDKVTVRVNWATRHKALSAALVKERDSLKVAEGDLKNLKYKADRKLVEIRAFAQITFGKWIVYQLSRRRESSSTGGP